MGRKNVNEMLEAVVKDNRKSMGLTNVKEARQYCFIADQVRIEELMFASSTH
jgi:hypothetical protein